MHTSRIYKIVVVEDEPIILNNIVSKIENTSACFQVAGRAYNGLDALKVIEQTMPDLLITDIQMPLMDGLELIKKVSELYPQILLVILTNYSDFEYAKEALSYGVKEYMLKTQTAVQTATLLEHMHRILEKRDYDSLNQYIANILLKHQYTHSDWSRNTIAWAENYRFDLHFIHFGNMSSRHTSPDILAFYKSIASADEVRDEVGGLLPNSNRWWLFDMPIFFGMYLIVIHDEENQAGVDDQLAVELLKRLRTLAGKYPVNIYSEGDPCRLAAIETHMYNLARVCEETRITGNPGCATVTGKENQTVTQVVDSKSAQKIKGVFLSQNQQELKERINKLIQFWELGGYPQSMVEMHILYFLDAVRQQKNYISDEETAHAEYSIISSLHRSIDLFDLEDGLYSLAESVLFEAEDLNVEDIASVVKRVGKYIEQNFTMQISLDDIAEKYHFTPSYLSRAFKKYLHVPPLKYIINLRVEKAKQLIGKNPELSFREIGEIVGYPDQNYFSRIFKNVTGLSLSEYAASIEEKKI